MSGHKGRSKAKIEMSKPDLPPFLQRIRQQLVDNEDADRRERSEKRKRDAPHRPDEPEDDPRIVQLEDGDLTEEQYKRMKKELETQYKLDDGGSKKSKSLELDVDTLIQNRNHSAVENKASSKGRSNSHSSNHDSKGNASSSSASGKKISVTSKQTSSKPSKTLSYGSSSSEDED